MLILVTFLGLYAKKQGAGGGGGGQTSKGKKEKGGPLFFLNLLGKNLKLANFTQKRKG